jgi:hypothetical protein
VLPLALPPRYPLPIALSPLHGALPLSLSHTHTLSPAPRPLSALRKMGRSEHARVSDSAASSATGVRAEVAALTCTHTRRKLNTEFARITIRNFCIAVPNEERAGSYQILRGAQLRQRSGRVGRGGRRRLQSRLTIQ